MSWWINTTYIICAYLVGALPHLQVLAKLKGVKLEGDYHACLMQKAGVPIAVLGVIGEFIKGAAPVIMGKLLGFDINFVAIAGVAAVCGQMWPFYHGFDGEKGNTIGISMSVCLAYQPALIALIPIALSAAIRSLNLISTKTNKMTSVFGGAARNSLPIGMFIGFLLLPLASWSLNQPSGVTLSFAVLFILIIVRRLTAGLTRDLQESSDYKRILKGRLFLDRGISKYRS
jgi:acyl phosphate:glycerol-3-phosphate acyltransferase